MRRPFALKKAFQLRALLLVTLLATFGCSSDTTVNQTGLVTFPESFRSAQLTGKVAVQGLIRRQSSGEIGQFFDTTYTKDTLVTAAIEADTSRATSFRFQKTGSRVDFVYTSQFFSGSISTFDSVVFSGEVDAADHVLRNARVRYLLQGSGSGESSNETCDIRGVDLPFSVNPDGSTRIDIPELELLKPSAQVNIARSVQQSSQFGSTFFSITTQRGATLPGSGLTLTLR